MHTRRRMHSHPQDRFRLWYWDLDRSGAAARAHGRGDPAFVFPEMALPELVGADWYPKFVDY